jgi:hypothetical protein
LATGAFVAVFLPTIFLATAGAFVAVPFVFAAVFLVSAVLVGCALISAVLREQGLLATTFPVLALRTVDAAGLRVALARVLAAIGFFA